MKSKFNIQQYQSEAVENAIAPLSNLVSLPYENT